MRKIDFSNLNDLLDDFDSDYGTIQGLSGEFADELTKNVQTLKEEIEGRGYWRAFMDLTGTSKQLIDEFTEWLFDTHFLFDWDDHELECNVTDYGLSVTRTNDLSDHEWSELLVYLRNTFPADWREADVTDLYIAVPKYYGVQQANNDAIDRLRKAGFTRMAETLRDPWSNIELTTEDIIAGHIVGVLLSGVTPRTATEFQSETLGAGLLPVWTNPTERKSQEEVLAIYSDVLRRLTEQ